MRDNNYTDHSIFNARSNVANMKLKEDFVLFGNTKDFESHEIVDFIILFVKLFIHKYKVNALLFMCLRNS